MTDHREVMRQALEALEAVEPHSEAVMCYASTVTEWPANAIPAQLNRAIAALRAALAKSAEPVAEFHAHPADWQYNITLLPGVPMLPDGTKLYAHPPAKREPLTDLERDAERYRFVRDADKSDGYLPFLGVYSMDSLDEHVDQGIAAYKRAHGIGGSND